MHPPRPTSIVISLLLTSVSFALQVSPSSPCSLQCIDNMNDNPADPSNSNTYGNDLTCQDSGYSTTGVGQKFASCLTCLQNSTYAGSGENDQEWFVYNLRYTVDWCLYGYPNNSATVGGPCLTAAACGPLDAALESGGLNPSNGSTYDYCSADGSTFMGQNLEPCTTCIRGLSNNNFLSNFLIALEAGCQQKPAAGSLLGLNGSVFSSTQVNITAPIIPSATNAPSGSSGTTGLSTGAKIGIIVGSTIGALILIAVGFVCWKKRKPKRALTSNYDPRFGALDITSPNQGGYTNPAHQTSPTTQTFVKYNPRDYLESEKSPGKESKLSTPSSIEVSPTIGGSQPSSLPYGQTSIPVHQAYLSNPRQSIQSTIYGPPASDRNRPSPTISAYSPQHSPDLTNRGQGRPPGPRSRGDHSTSVSASISSTLSSSATAVPSRKLSRTSARDREEGLALRYQQHHQQHIQLPAPPPPPPPPQIHVPLRRTMPAKTGTSENTTSGDVEQWPGSM